MSRPALATDWLSTTDAAPLLCNISPRAVRNLIPLGTRTPRGVIKLRAQPMGNRLYTRPMWIQEFLRTVAEANGTAAATASDSTIDDHGDNT